MHITRFFLMRWRDVFIAVVALMIYMLIVGRTTPRTDEIAYVAFDPFETTSTIRLLDVERALSVSLFQRYGRIDDLSWSPDGDVLYFGLFREERIGRDLASLNLSSGDFHWLTDFPPDNNVPEASPDGTQLVFQHFDEFGTEWNIHILDLQTGEIRLLYGSLGNNGRPVWADDGRTVIFEQYRSSDVCIVRIAAESGIGQSSVCGDARDLTWSPDRQLTAFDRYNSGASEVYIADANGQNWRQMTRMGGNAYSADWSPDGERLVFVYGQTPGLPDALYIMRLVGETPVQITPADTIHIALSWRPY